MKVSREQSEVEVARVYLEVALVALVAQVESLAALVLVDL